MITEVLAALVAFPAMVILTSFLARQLRAMQPTGTHRAGEPLPHSPYPDAEPGEFRYCPDELRSTYHAIHTDGSRTCFTCWTRTEANQ